MTTPNKLYAEIERQISKYIRLTECGDSSPKTCCGDSRQSKCGEISEAKCGDGRPRPSSRAQLDRSLMNELWPHYPPEPRPARPRP